MAVFRLLAGGHQQQDPNAEVDQKTGRRALKFYTAGQLVPSENDLVAMFGADKFALVSGTPRMAATPGDRAARSIARDPSKAPHGQVSTGFPQATGKQPVGETGLDPTEAEHLATVDEETMAQLDGLEGEALRAVAESRGVDVSSAETDDQVRDAIRGHTGE